jgi:hypothetical protein
MLSVDSDVVVGIEPFYGLDGPGCGLDHPHLPSAVVNKEWSCTFTPPLCQRGVLRGDLYLYFNIIVRSVLAFSK